MVVISCDPGQTGGICIFEDGKLVESVHVPQREDKSVDIVTLIKWFYLWRDIYAENYVRVYSCIEYVRSMPGQGVSSTFKFGRTTGQLEALLRTLSYDDHAEIRPQDWKKYYNLKGKNKHEAVELALEMEPNLLKKNIKQEGYINKERQSGIADAFLIGTYYIRTRL